MSFFAEEYIEMNTDPDKHCNCYKAQGSREIDQSVSLNMVINDGYS